MTQVTCPDDILNRIWRIFASQGIGDDLQIIESLAYLLLVKHIGQWPEIKKLEQKYPDFSFPDLESILLDSGLFRNIDLPKSIISLSSERTREFLHLIEPILNQTDLAELLNHCLIFRLNSMQAGGRYPTPRHLARLMADLVRSCTDDLPTVADFACGSGGLLAEFDLNSVVSGIEISPTWARIARANLLLHNQVADAIYTGNSLEVAVREFSEQSGYATFSGPDQIIHKFDAIIMNPPFGHPLEEELIWRSLRDNVGRRSETVLTLLALNHLQTNGVLAVLQPGGTFFSTSHGELTLRSRLLVENRLEAIIQLPKDAFQPYSQLQTYLLLARHTAQSSLEANAPVWFYHIVHDGFSSGRNRQPQPEQSQLPQLLAAVAAGEAENLWSIHDETGGVQLAIQPLVTGGYRIGQPDSGKLTVHALTVPETTALWLTRQSETTNHALLFQEALWQKHPIPAIQNSIALKPMTFRLANDSNQEVELKKDKKTWKLSLKSSEEVTLSERITLESGYLGLFVDVAGNLLSPLLALSSLHKEYVPKPLAVLPLENETNESAGSLLFWDGAAIQPLFFASASGEKGWLMLAGNEEAALIRWANGTITNAFSGQLKRTFGGESWHRGVMVDSQGIRFGVGVAPIHIRDEHQFDLTFDRYYPPDESEPTVQRSAAQILAEMRHKQQGLSHRLDYLLGIVEMRPAHALPPPVVDVMPFGALNRSQLLVWQRIVAMNEEVDGVAVARPFRPEELAAGLNEAEVNQALVLFERMGLVVLVIIDGGQYYRRLTEQDLVTA
ncbi:MAG: N-6 DNA methylase [Anaerolineae bacterium]|nr:N-6 DNA methylase [Anaerolineae bacterium]